jgi:5,10-methylenetetrahydrofolate reductase
MGIQKRLEKGDFVVIAEMTPPKGVDISRFLTAAQRIHGRVDAVSVPDMENAVMHMSALGAGVLMQRQGLDPLIHIYARDRNRLALQGDLLSAHVLGLNDLVVVSGEEMDQGDHRDAKPVDDLDELALLQAIGTLQSGKDLAGFELDGAPEFYTGTALDRGPRGGAGAAEHKAAAARVDAGARFIITPPIFDVEGAAAVLDPLEKLGVPVIPTVFLVKSVAVARYIATHEPEAGLGEDLIRRIRKASDREQECLRIAGELVSAVKSRYQGVLIQTLGWEHRLPAILDAAGL